MKNLRFFSAVLFSALLGIIAFSLFSVNPFAVGGAVFALSLLPMEKAIIGMNNTNNFSARASYDVAKDIFMRAWMGSFKGDRSAAKNYVDSLKLSQSELRLETTLTTTNNIFTFGVTPNQANSANVIFSTEQRLNLQDSLVAYEYGIFVGNPQTSASTDSAYQLYSYGNTIAFPTSATALNQTFFSNSYFQVKVNNDTIIPYRGLFNNLYKGQTQQTAALGAASPADQIRGAEDGFVTMEPNILFVGSKNYVPQIVLPAAMSAVDANTRVVLILRGILAQNSTVVN